MSACTVPGCAMGQGPHDRQAHVVGDWTGEGTAARGRAVETLAGIRAGLVSLHADLCRDRQRWAEQDGPGCVERAVAYQSAASRVLSLVDLIDGAGQ